MNYDIIRYTPAAAVADNGTVTLPYPSGKTAASYLSTGAAIAVVATNATLKQGDAKGINVTYGGPSITVTNLGDTPWPAGGELVFQAPLVGGSIDSLTPIATADATDPATTMALANECKAKVNAIISALKA